MRQRPGANRHAAEFISQTTETDRFGRAVDEASRPKPIAQRIVNRIVRLLPGPVQKALRRDAPSPIVQALSELAQTRADVVFVQIGSCDGTTGDPLYEHIVARGWSGVVVEPVPANFARLVETYRTAQRVKCENVAISDREHVRPFYHVVVPEDVDAPEWCRQIGSFDRSHLVKHARMWNEVPSYIVETPVHCISLRQLLERNGIDRIDVLHTDVEGFDFQILQQLDFEAYRPELIIYEDLHMRDADRREAARMLRAQGYTLTNDDMNTLARRVRP